MWPVFRQNSISIRGAVDPYGDRDYNNVIEPTIITDKNIKEIVAHQLYNPSNAQVYVMSRMYYYQQSSSITTPRSISALTWGSSKAKSLPVVDSIYRDNRFAYSGSPYLVPGRATRKAHAEADQYRMLGYDSYTNEKLTLNVDIEFARLCAGDLVSISSQKIYGLCEEPGQTYQNRIGMVIATQYNISKMKAELIISILPTQKYRDK